MNIETQLYLALGPLVGDRALPDFAPEGTPLPFITFQSIGGQPLSFLDGSAPNKEFSRVQVNVWAQSRVEASDIAKAVEGALRAISTLQTEVLTGRIATFDETTEYRGTMQDFSFFT